MHFEIGQQQHHQLQIVYGIVLVIAGLYQFSSLKTKCLRYCESPLSFFMRRWRSGSIGAIRMGTYHGLIRMGIYSGSSWCSTQAKRGLDISQSLISHVGVLKTKIMMYAHRNQIQTRRYIPHVLE
jgi:hypothetical protein